MAIEAAFDNDVLIKLSAYGLLPEVIAALGVNSTVGVLGASRFLVPKAIERDKRLLDRDSALACWEAVLPSLKELEPTDDEIALATRIEELSLTNGLAMDGGESQLCAIALLRGVPHILTGDKRAIASSEQLRALAPELNELGGRLVCLEQVIAGAATRIGSDAVRTRVCANPDVDRALTICFECTGLGVGHPADPAGLRSYVADVRRTAPTMLCAADSWPPVSLSS